MAPPPCPPRLHIPSISLLPAPATIALVRFRAISRAFFCARLIFSYPVISYTRLRSPCSLRRYCPPRQFLALHVKSPACRERRSKRQIHGRHALISRPSHLFISVCLVYHGSARIFISGHLVYTAPFAMLTPPVLPATLLYPAHLRRQVPRSARGGYLHKYPPLILSPIFPKTVRPKTQNL